MGTFIKALFILVFLVGFVALAIWIGTNQDIMEWIWDLILGTFAGLLVAWFLAFPVDAVFDSGDEETYNAGKWVLTIIGIAVAIFVTVWLHENVNLT